jgi:branched-chain amino acid transport system permease protein
MTDAGAPRDWLRQRSRWSAWEIAFWLAALLPFLLFPTYLTQPRRR